jgi:gamma-glutamyltranspeptidase
MLAFSALLMLQVVAADTLTPERVRTPSFSPDGHMVVSVGGDIMLRQPGGNVFRRITNGSSWDRDPAFSRDGKSILFASDREGQYDIYRMSRSDDGWTEPPKRVTSSLEPELSPSDAGNGRIFFVRGNAAAPRIWIREANGSEKRAHNGAENESWVRVSPDGARYAYIATNESGRRLVVRSITGKDSSIVNADRGVERFAWAPDNQRLAFSTRTGTFVTPIDGRYTNFVSTKRGDVAWSPDDRVIAVAEYDEIVVGYNGDPDRALDRTATEQFGSSERMYFVTAPVAPDHSLTETPVNASLTRATRNADAFDRVWDRSNRLYFDTPDAAARRKQWEVAWRALRPRAIAATSDDELQSVMHELLARRPTLRAEASGRAAVSSAHPVATEAGLEMLRAGGNVVDAAVAVSFALGVVEPDASGIGGYGQMVIALQSLEKPTLIEFMSRVPEDAALSNTSLLQNGRYPSDGPVLANIPGTVAGMYEAWKKYGGKTLPWARLLEPAIRAARSGYVVSEGLATTLATEREHFAKYEGSRALFFRDGEPLVAGDTLRNPDLAWVLEHIAKNGADGFYRGDVATKYANDLRAKGNAMKLSDLARYFAPERAPVSGRYREYTIYSSSPPVSGGAELVGRLNLLEQFPAPKLYTDDAPTLHAALSAWFLVPSSRGRIADPAMWPVDVAPIVDRDTARIRWRCYDPARALRPADLRGEQLACAKGTTQSPARSEASRNESATEGDAHAPCGDDHAREMSVCHAAGTTAFTVADNAGNVVAVTQTLGTWGGNFYVTPGLGFLSNDKLTSYGTDPAQYGSRLPFARHGSTIAPTVVYRGRTPVFAIGAAGNAWITSAIYQGLIGALDFNLGPQRVLELPRFLPGGGRGGGAGGGNYSIQMEDGFSPSVIKRMRELGYDISFVSMRGELREGYGAAVRIDGKTVTAGADPRRSGSAGAIR